jgi:hypothetical protein
MNRTITTEDPEFDDILRELALNREAVLKRRELSDASFREWLFKQITDIGRRLGLIIQDVAEFALDMAYGFKKGFGAGREEARRKSIRAREGK